MTDKNIIDIEKFPVFYGFLSVKEEDGVYFIGYPEHSYVYYTPAPKYLYDALVKYNDDKDYTNDD